MYNHLDSEQIRLRFFIGYLYDIIDQEQMVELESAAKVFSVVLSSSLLPHVSQAHLLLLIEMQTQAALQHLRSDPSRGDMLQCVKRMQRKKCRDAIRDERKKVFQQLKELAEGEDDVVNQYFNAHPWKDFSLQFLNLLREWKAHLGDTLLQKVSTVNHHLMLTRSQLSRSEQVRDRWKKRRLEERTMDDEESQEYPMHPHPLSRDSPTTNDLPKQKATPEKTAQRKDMMMMEDLLETQDQEETSQPHDVEESEEEHPGEDKAFFTQPKDNYASPIKVR